MKPKLGGKSKSLVVKSNMDENKRFGRLNYEVKLEKRFSTLSIVGVVEGIK